MLRSHTGMELSSSGTVRIPIHSLSASNRSDLIKQFRTHLRSKEYWNVVMNRSEEISGSQKGSLPVAIRRTTASSKPSSRIKKRFQCNRCGSNFQRIGHLKTHVDTVHSGMRPHFCPHGCGKIYGHRSSLNRHIRSSHENPIPSITIKDDLSKPV